MSNQPAAIWNNIRTGLQDEGPDWNYPDTAKDYLPQDVRAYRIYEALQATGIEPTQAYNATMIAYLEMHDKSALRR